MRAIVYATLLVAFATACSKQQASDNSIQILAHIESGAALTEKDCDDMLSELNRMFDEVSSKAEILIDSGVKKVDVREHLKQDSAYQTISRDASVIDSALTEYITSGKASPEFLAYYKEVTARAAGRAQKIGLIK